MGHFSRFIITDDQPITIPMMAEALTAYDSRYRFANTQIPDIAELYHGSTYCGEIEISRSEEEIFGEELEEFAELVRFSSSPAREAVLEVLRTAQVMIVMDAEWRTTESDEVLDLIEPLWDWCFAHYKGLLQMDHYGFFDANTLILEMNVRI